MKKNNHKHSPFPEIVSGKGGWKIYENAKNPHTSNMTKEMHVPLDGECDDCGVNHSKYIRRHELAHVKWSPITIGKLGPDEDSQSVEVCEEVRVNYLLALKKMAISEYIMCEDIVEKMHYEAIYNMSEYDLICYLMSQMWWVPDLNDKYYMYSYSRDPINKEILLWNSIWQKVSNSGELTLYRKQQINWAIRKAWQFYKQICGKGNRNRSYSNTVSYRKVRSVAKKLHLLRDEFSEPPTEEEVFESVRKAKQAERMASKQNRLAGKQDEETMNGSLEEAMLKTKQQLNDNLAESDMNYQPDINDMTGRWGRMEIYQPDLTVNLQGKIKGGREYRPMDYGVNPKYMNRWCVDKKVFSQRQKTYGGTILIDASGSMSFSGDDILEIMQILPAVKIAMYNSSNNLDGWHYDTGSLRIIGDRGRRVNQEYLDKYSGHGNLVDGPALRWLSKQAPKRIWVSDMMVFGLHNYNSANLLKECYQIMKQSGIIRLANIDEVKKFALQINQL